MKICSRDPNSWCVRYLNERNYVRPQNSPVLDWSTITIQIVDSLTSSFWIFTVFECWVLALVQVNHSKYLYEWNTVKNTRYILSINDNHQLMLALHKMFEVKQRARPYLGGRLESVTWPDKWSHNRIVTLFIWYILELS